MQRCVKNLSVSILCRLLLAEQCRPFGDLIRRFASRPFRRGYPCATFVSLLLP